MSATTGIEWTDATWNPVVGCTKVSQGCTHCYAKTIHDMRHKAHLAGKAVAPQYAVPFETVQLMPERLAHPLAWRKPRRVFVNSVSDLFHEDVPFEYIATVFGVMAAAKRHTFQVLTKRPERMVEFFAWLPQHYSGPRRTDLAWYSRDLVERMERQPDADWVSWPLTNVWLGCSVEDQKAADERIPLLLETPAAVRFLSCEPLLGPVDLSKYLLPLHLEGHCACRGVHWVIAGGESGKGARPMHPDWARSLRDQCGADGVPFFFKQVGEWASAADRAFGTTTMKDPAGTQWIDSSGAFLNPPPLDEDADCLTVVRVGKKRAGRELDGRTWDEFPEGRA